MKTLIVYATRHGSSEKAANMLKMELNSEVTLYNLKEKTQINFNDFDALIIGGSIHVGEINSRLKKLIQTKTEELLKKHLGLFLCCMDKEKAQIQFENAFNKDLRAQATAIGLFGGEFIFENMNWFERLVVKKITGVDKSVSEIDEFAIKRFAEKFNLLPQ